MSNISTLHPELQEFLRDILKPLAPEGYQFHLIHGQKDKKSYDLDYPVGRLDINLVNRKRKSIDKYAEDITHATHVVTMLNAPFEDYRDGKIAILKLLEKPAADPKETAEVGKMHSLDRSGEPAPDEVQDAVLKKALEALETSHPTIYHRTMNYPIRFSFVVDSPRKLKKKAEEKPAEVPAESVEMPLEKPAEVPAEKPVAGEKPAEAPAESGKKGGKDGK